MRCELDAMPVRDGPLDTSKAEQDEPSNGLEAMTSPNKEAMFGINSNQRRQAEPSFESYVSARLRAIDPEILRGITLRESLRRGGSLWRKNPEYLPAFDCASFNVKVKEDIWQGGK